METVPASSSRLMAAATELGLPPMELRQFPEGTKTAVDAANAIGCEVAMIVKSLVFAVDEVPVLALVPGDLRLDTVKLSAVAGGSTARRATLEEVRSATGFAAGGTPPFGHATELAIFADQHLARFETLWAAGGTPDTVFPISYSDLLRVTRAQVVDVTE